MNIAGSVFFGIIIFTFNLWIILYMIKQYKHSNKRQKKWQSEADAFDQIFNAYFQQVFREKMERNLTPKTLEDDSRERIFGVYKHYSRNTAYEQHVAEDKLLKMLKKHEMTLTDFIREYKVYGKEKQYV